MIGFFDSGSGGLTVLSAFLKAAPKADILYFGDIANAPYGSRSPEKLQELTRLGVELLRARSATSLVSACNSVSASVLAGVANDMPYVEMSLPTANFLQNYLGKKFLLIATPATIESKLYENAIGGTVTLDSLPISALAGAIEAGKSKEEIKSIIREALLQKKGQHYDGLVLGCTHYPLVREVIKEVVEEVFGQDVEMVDPAYAVAHEASVRFDIQGEGKLAFYISQDSNVFREWVQTLFPERQYTIEVI